QPTEDVSLAVGTLSRLNCSFAVRSGGHSPNAGFANLAGSVTLDLRNLTTVSLSQDETGSPIVCTGVGNMWGQVYEALERHTEIGRWTVGWTCNMVRNFEIVLADGFIVQTQSYGVNGADLDFALRGGSNNFGIVPCMDFTPVELGSLWGGFVVSLIDTIPEQLAAFANFSNADTYDDYSSLIMSLSYVEAAQLTAVANSIVYTKPVANLN
ncbi:hypothetical protein HK405_003334, partial [Cladochytrium tenue]